MDTETMGAMLEHGAPLPLRGMPLVEVTTIGEVCSMWGKSRKAVLNHVWRGRFAARKSCGTWLILTSDVVDYWGLPLKGIEND